MNGYDFIRSKAVGISVLWLVLAYAASVRAQTNDVAPACATPLDARIESSCIVDPGKLWRGAKPTKEAAAALAGNGVRTIVNLEWLQCRCRLL